ncbi:transcriptional regulator, TetR family [Saccharopolyspora kobensis]|uniref:Transcriptional regulator, TetR family n=1 Tax=Saccharopolyspora kobensis TaxID=146035 RepID=A0A1H6DBY2_9PSEU|nr:TetR/AcrR family transcriptional regulator [Saccharopolyspora kobensis]SEG82977.1 transcriptional regulator, TetR family [Saccharopolyspora kobensis]SFE27445.1 transcriptional regulator, TetR family [Saccharopolyspora kobensis]
MADRRIERGNRTRQLVLRRAVDLASVEGLDGLSLGRLAGELELSKSGVFALFGSKEDLQLATIGAATEVFVEHVIEPANAAPPGIDRLWRTCDGWLTYSRDRVFPGGCFFYAASAEFDARSGKVHDALVAARANWSRHLERTARDAQRAGEVAPGTDIPQLVFELAAFLEMANAESVLHDEFTCYDKASRAVLNRLRAAATDPAALPE